MSANHDGAAGQRDAGQATPPRVSLDLSNASKITLRRLQIFWAVAQATSLTRAAKQLGMAQPSLSQQIAGLETAVGALLFDRSANRMQLTEDGETLLRLAERVLVGMQALEDGVAAFGRPDRRTLRIAGPGPVLRVLLPPAIEACRGALPGAEFDLREAPPAEVLELLQTRRISVGLLAGTVIPEAGTGFTQVPVAEDPYVLAAPERLDLSALRDLAALPRDRAAVLESVIRFDFDAPDQAWFDEILPRHRSFARVRSYETGLAMVQRGLGVCLVPAMATLAQGAALPGIRLYHAGLAPRRIVAALPTQALRIASQAALIEALQAAGRDYRLPEIYDFPAIPGKSSD